MRWIQINFIFENFTITRKYQKSDNKPRNVMEKSLPVVLFFVVVVFVCCLPSYFFVKQWQFSFWVSFCAARHRRRIFALCLGFRGAGRRGLLSEFNDTNKWFVTIRDFCSLNESSLRAEINDVRIPPESLPGRLVSRQIALVLSDDDADDDFLNAAKQQNTCTSISSWFAVLSWRNRAKGKQVPPVCHQTSVLGTQPRRMRTMPSSMFPQGLLAHWPRLPRVSLIQR